MQLSEHFHLDELLQSQAADRLGIDLNEEVTHDVIARLHRLAQDVLQPIRDEVGAPVHVSSGWRPQEVNDAVGGAENSRHMQGTAADIYTNTMSAKELYDLIEGLDLPLVELILYDSHVHVAIS